MNATLTRREFVRSAGVATVAAAALPSALAQEKKIVVALVGGAHIHTPGFIDLVKKRKDVMVKSVWDHDADRAEKRAKELGSNAVGDVKQIWSDPEIAAVVIFSET